MCTILLSFILNTGLFFQELPTHMVDHAVLRNKDIRFDNRSRRWVVCS